MDELNSKSLELMNVASSKGSWKPRDPLLSVANGCWVDQRYSLKPFFKETLQSIYKVESKAMDFENKGDEVVDEVNSWVKNETKGLIQGILDSSEDLDMLKVILANALYFKGTWDPIFDVSNTSDKTFIYSMEKKSKLPSCTRGMDGNNMDHLRVSRFSGCLIKMSKINGDSQLSYFWIPKFKFSCRFRVSQVMQELGLKEPSIMLCSPHGQEFPASASINHKAVIEVNETGTEAAAVTELDCGCCLDAPPPVPFVADHPFVFMIMEDESRIPLFVGAVVNPLLG
ncbi:serpin-ZX [Quercus suber]|uniref:serpin-ZX n=1 Tax=Quercus suber TaxID=58331 RepID=UPI000CE1FB8C|nr:serpin-ZX-like [Quercus suber]